MRRLVVGDIHGAYKALIDVLEKAKFNPSEDLLIGIGDYVDGYSQTYEVIEYLMSLPNFVGVKGNHDSFFLEWANEPDYSPQPIWTTQGGTATLRSYDYKVNIKHRDWLNALPSYIELDNYLFVHGGYIPYIDIKDQDDQDDQDLQWDRDLIKDSVMGYESIDIKYDRVFVGHTALKDVWVGKKVIGIDTGAGWQGKLTVMNIDTLEYWQSETTAILYPNEQGR